MVVSQNKKSTIFLDTLYIKINVRKRDIWILFNISCKVSIYEKRERNIVQTFSCYCIDLDFFLTVW